ncbi:MAG: hypothetical protein JWQ44_1654 [Chthoniobacter sp.]|nr:hypothetical protein [Chthoniobacter sp.]
MAGGALFFAGREWITPAAITFGAACLLIGWSYARTSAPRGLKILCAALKLVGFATLLACLLEPMWSDQRSKPGANLLAIVADNSLSMQLRGRGETESRGEALQSAINGPVAWREKLAESFGVRNYLADSNLQPTQDFRELDFTGRTSAIATSLKALAERYRGQPLAGIVLLTDGVASDAEALDLEGLPPVYPIVLGSDQAPRDLAVSNTAVSQSAFEDAPVMVQADVAVIGAPGEDVVAQLFVIDSARPDAAAKPVLEQTLTTPRDGEKLTFRFQLRPEKTGVLFYRVRVGLKSETDPATSTEATLVNNETIVTVDRGAEKQRVLYVGGRPNWEYKFLQRAVAEDLQTELVGLIRVAKREAKFEFRGRAGESSNPLFRGFGNQSGEEVERYDQPVLIRLNTRDEFELRAGFPKLPEDLFQYRAVILDDLEAEFFTAEQMTLLQRFVSERGGGLLMLGGAESFGDGKFQRTPIGEMLPAYLDGAEPATAGAPLRLALTREGWLQPWARLRSNEPEESRRLGEAPPFEILNRVRESKPAAMVVATVTDGRTDFPALITQRFGRGRTAALLVGDFWQSGLGDEARQKDLGKAWRQMVRWLVADVPEPIEIRVTPQQDGESVRLQVRVRDPNFEPLENAGVVLKVQPVGTAEPLTLNTEPSASEPGVYEASYVPRASGGFKAEATITDEQGAAFGVAQSGWTTDLAAAEFRSLVPNRALMQTIANKTGGEVITVGGLEAFARTLPAKRAPITETFTKPLWHTPAVLLFALACFVSEWGIRRWKGLS